VEQGDNEKWKRGAFPDHTVVSKGEKEKDCAAFITGDPLKEGKRGDLWKKKGGFFHTIKEWRP